MRICIVSLVHFNNSNDNKYNTQDVGLARAFASLHNDVQVIHFEKRINSFCEELISPHLSLLHYKTRSIGNNSIGIIQHLPKDVDMMICFSDIQLGFFEVYLHCKKHKIELYPYIGVITSHNSNILIRKIMHIGASVNLWLYKNLTVFAKTDYIKKLLTDKKIKKIHVMPVGLDLTELDMDTTDNRNNLRHSFFKDISENEPILLFVGQLIEKKRPIEALEIFRTYIASHSSCKMIFVGKGKLLDEINYYITENNLADKIKIFNDVPNKEMYKFYIAADALLNCNRVEIFGMCILEAMFYECPVVAYAAPGPQMIIVNEEDGYLFKSQNEALNKLELAIQQGRRSHARITVSNHFSWTNIAKRIIELHFQKQS